MINPTALFVCFIWVFAPSRQPETAAVSRTLAVLGYDTATIEAPGTLDGGDVLKVGNTVYVGLGGRTNAAGIAQLGAHLGSRGAVVVTVPCTKVLHLKSAVTALPDGNRFYVLGNPSGTSLTLTAVDSVTLQPLLSQPPNSPNPYLLDVLNSGGTAVPAVPFCGGARVRFMVGSSADSVRVYVSSCDAGGTYIFRTSDSTGVLLLASPDQPPTGGGTPPQNPVFMITGR
jgi:hypothetical protein